MAFFQELEDTKGLFFSGCTREQFQCRSNGVCIPGRQRCDLIYNCDDGSDEIDCRKLISIQILLNIYCLCF